MAVLLQGYEKNGFDIDVSSFVLERLENYINHITPMEVFYLNTYL
jgi:hypothetical protein